MSFPRPTFTFNSTCHQFSVQNLAGLPWVADPWNRYTQFLKIVYLRSRGDTNLFKINAWGRTLKNVRTTNLEISCGPKSLTSCSYIYSLLGKKEQLNTTSELRCILGENVLNVLRVARQLILLFLMQLPSRQ